MRIDSKMDETYDQMAHSIISLANKRRGSQLLIGIAGPPGVGMWFILNRY